MWHSLNLSSSTKSGIEFQFRDSDEIYYNAFFWVFDYKKLGCIYDPINHVNDPVAAPIAAAPVAAPIAAAPVAAPIAAAPAAAIDPALLHVTGPMNLNVLDIQSIKNGRFTLHFLTDSVGTSFTFVKAVPPPPPVDPSLANDDQAEAFKRLGYDPAFDSIGFVDPGRTDLFTLLYPTLTKLSPQPSSVKSYSLTKHYEGLELKSKKPARIISMSNKEFYHIASRTQCNKIRARYLADHDRHLHPEAKLEHINSTCPSPKASSLNGFLQFVDHKLKHLTTFTNHYDRRYRVLKMRTYRGNMFIY
jgi:hypothetical protein